jgi:hypothetical protein
MREDAMSLHARAPLQGELLFREVQTFGWPWPGMLIVVIGLVTAGAVMVPFGLGMWQQLVMGRPWGDKPMPDAMLYVVGPLAILLSLLPFALLFSRLLVEVRTDGMRIELVRFRRPQVIARAEVREARAARIRWSGWGASDTPFRRVYRMAGSDGVEIERTRGKKVVVGSERARALLDAVRRMMEETRS